MKRIVSIITFCLIFFLPSLSLSFAYHHSMPQQSIHTFLERIDGDWYDYAGNLAMTVENDSINGCPVTAAFDFAGGYPESGTIRITEAAGNRDIYIYAFGQGYHTYIVLNKTLPLRKTPHARYVESVAGLHLGMTPSEVCKLYGKPTQISPYLLAVSDRSRYMYQHRGVSIDFDDNAIAVNITLYKQGPSHFDSTGYTCANSLADYHDTYGLTRMPSVPIGSYTSSGAYGIGQGEYLYFDTYPESITLSLYGY